MEDVLIDPATGRMQIPIRNDGTATWPWRDLEVELQTRSGESLGIYTWEMFVLEAGQSTVLEHPDILLTTPYDACVVIDPNNLVMEEYEAHDVLFHTPVCPPLPDLVIDDVFFDPAAGGTGGGHPGAAGAVRGRRRGDLRPRSARTARRALRPGQPPQRTAGFRL